MPRKLYGRGLADLGRAIDERINQNTNKLVYPQDLGRAIPAPSSGGTAGAGGGAGGTAPGGQAGPVVLHYPGVNFAPANITVWDEGEVAPHAFRAIAWPGGAGLAPVTAEPQTAAGFDAPRLGRSCTYFSWASEPEGELQVRAGAAVAVCCACAKAWHGAARSGRAVVRACVRVEAAARFSALKLVLGDLDADEISSHSAAADVLGGVADGEWAEVVLAAAGTDISAWGGQLRAGLFALGTDSAAGTGLTEFGVAWLQVELWPE
jgi:hypothetical protein